ncbi:MAG: PIN domain-containing protein [Acetobacteraceae bacterium]
MRALFDTNIGLSALVFGGRLAWLHQGWSRSTLTPLVCRETAAELSRVLAYPKFRVTPVERDLLFPESLPFAEVARLSRLLPAIPLACRDCDDTAFIHLPRAAKVDCLVSGDSELRALSDLPPVPIVSLEAIHRRVAP